MFKQGDNIIVKASNKFFAEKHGKEFMYIAENTITDTLGRHYVQSIKSGELVTIMASDMEKVEEEEYDYEISITKIHNGDYAFDVIVNDANSGERIDSMCDYECFKTHLEALKFAQEFLQKAIDKTK